MSICSYKDDFLETAIFQRYGKILDLFQEFGYFSLFLRFKSTLIYISSRKMSIFQSALQWATFCPVAGVPTFNQENIWILVENFEQTIQTFPTFFLSSWLLSVSLPSNFRYFPFSFWFLVNLFSGHCLW